MKKRRDLKTWSKRNVPDDLWFEILTRVPVKSALRFRCVAKSWKAMIDDPRFGRIHFTRFNNNRRESHLLVVQGYRKVEWVVRCSKTLRTTDRHLRFPATDASYSIVSSIDGLFMLSGSIPWCSPELVLWNPSIGNIRRLPPLPIIQPHKMRYFEFGLGFDPLSQDYKYVTFILGRKTRNRVEFIAIYTVGTGTWKTVWFQDEELRNRFTFAYPHKPFCLRGVLYCLAIDETVGHFKLVSFDLKYELFAYASLPNEGVVQDSHYFNYYRSQALTLIDGGNSLALVDMSMPKGTIWVTDCIGDDMNSFIWTQRHTFPTVFPGYNDVAVLFLYLRKIDEDELLLKAHNVVISFNLKTHKIRVMLNKCLWVDKIWPHMESMILQKG